MMNTDDSIATLKRLAKRSRAGLVCPLTAAWCIGIAPAHADNLEFEIETVLADGMFNNRSSVDVDSNGVVHMAWMTQVGTDDASKEIMYANNASGTWKFTQVTDDNVRQEFPSLTLDGNDNVHIAFHTGIPDGNKVQYVNNIGAEPGEFNDIIDITDGFYVIAEVRVDDQGVAHFTFRSQTIGVPGEDVYYTTWSQRDGVGELVNLSNSPGADASASRLAIDSNGVVHLVYQAGGAFGGPLVYLTNASGTFEAQPTGVTDSVRDPMLLISDDDVVSILFRIGNVLYAIDDGGIGSFSDPDPLFTDVTALPAFYERFAIDADGRRHVAFASNSGDLRGIFYIGENEDGWDDPIHIDGDTTGNLGTSIAVTDEGTVFVTYSQSGFDSDQGMVFADLFMATRETAILGDINGDGVVDIEDLFILLAAWGMCTDPSDCPEDLDGNGVVDVEDLFILLANWS